MIVREWIDQTGLQKNHLWEPRAGRSNSAWIRFVSLRMESSTASWVLPHSSWEGFHTSWKRAQAQHSFAVSRDAGRPHTSPQPSGEKSGPHCPESHCCCRYRSQERATGWKWKGDQSIKNGQRRQEINRKQEEETLEKKTEKREE